MPKASRAISAAMGKAMNTPARLPQQASAAMETAVPAQAARATRPGGQARPQSLPAAARQTVSSRMFIPAYHSPEITMRLASLVPMIARQPSGPCRLRMRKRAKKIPAGSLRRGENEGEIRRRGRR